MFKKQKMIITMKRETTKQTKGTLVEKEVWTYRSSYGLLKKLKKEAKCTDEYARIMELNGFLTLVIHKPYLDIVTVHPADSTVRDYTSVDEPRI
jgi:hypothetical protein